MGASAPVQEMVKTLFKGFLEGEAAKFVQRLEQLEHAMSWLITLVTYQYQIAHAAGAFAGLSPTQLIKEAPPHLGAANLQRVIHDLLTDGQKTSQDASPASVMQMVASYVARHETRLDHELDGTPVPSEAPVDSEVSEKPGEDAAFGASTPSGGIVRTGEKDAKRANGDARETDDGLTNRSKDPAPASVEPEVGEKDAKRANGDARETDDGLTSRSKDPASASDEPEKVGEKDAKRANGDARETDSGVVNRSEDPASAPDEPTNAGLGPHARAPGESAVGRSAAEPLTNEASSSGETANTTTDEEDTTSTAGVSERARDTPNRDVDAKSLVARPSQASRPTGGVTRVATEARAATAVTGSELAAGADATSRSRVSDAPMLENESEIVEVDATKTSETKKKKKKKKKKKSRRSSSATARYQGRMRRRGGRS